MVAPLPLGEFSVCVFASDNTGKAEPFGENRLKKFKGEVSFSGPIRRALLYLRPLGAQR